MRENVFSEIDDALARAGARPPRRSRVTASAIVPVRTDDITTHQDDSQPRLLDRAIWPQLFFAIQFLWGVPLFFPGSQTVRFMIRALPYVSALILLVAYELNRARRGPLPRGAGLLIAALLLLVVNLLHPTSQPVAGIAQCIFQLSIAAPMFWMHKAVRSPRQLTMLFVAILVMNFAGAAMGVLQVYFPDRYMPPEFSARLGESMLEALSYVGADGRIITRPPGLSDTPGGAAIAGGLTALIGMGLVLHTRKFWHSLALVAMIGVGLAAVYLTQVRSVLLMVIGAAIVVGVLALRQGHVQRALWAFAVGSSLVVGSFIWASSIGGSSVEGRFLSIREQGALSTYQTNRGDFLSRTAGELLDQYPLGAGVGRWGMMHQYFGDPFLPNAESIYVEIQPTGWLLDGGLPMWLLYGGAVLASIASVLGLAFGRDPDIANIAPLVVAVQLFIVGMSLSGPAFNTQLGILFWGVSAALFGAARGNPEAASHEQVQ